MFGGTESDFEAPGVWRFRLMGVPVSVHPLFWLVGLFFSPFYCQTGNTRDLLIAMTAWMAAWFAAVLTHELGHALTIRKLCGSRPWITLFGFGGVTQYYDADYRSGPSTLRLILTSFAGPAAGFLVAGLILLIYALCGSGINVLMQSFGPVPVPIILPLWVSEGLFNDGPLLLLALNVFVFSMIWTSLFWGLLNLLPILPLDGGNIAMAILSALDPRSGRYWTHLLSALSAGLIAFILVRQGWFIAAVLFAFLAVDNLRKL
ncbi:MAG: site-2 protease family protein [Planctomycetia bacterium]|nr:site-2 protease family protein [Planctomycetia bacterium]